MTRRRYKKPYRAKRKKPFFLKRSFWAFSAVLASAGGLVWFFCFSPVFEIKSVQVLGNEKTSGEDCQRIIEELAQKKLAFLSSKSILLLDLGHVNREILEKFPQIKNIEIKRQFPGTIYASVKERTPVAIFNANDSAYFLLDDGGVIFERAEKRSDLAEIRIAGMAEGVAEGQKVIDQDLLVKLLRFRADAQDQSDLAITGALFVTDERINFTTSEGWQIFVNPSKDIDWQLTKLDAVMTDPSFEAKRGNLEYVELRFTRVYLKQKQAGVLIDEPQEGQQPQQGPQEGGSGPTIAAPAGSLN